MSQKNGILNPLNAELNPIRHLLALVAARHTVHVSRMRVNVIMLQLKREFGAVTKVQRQNGRYIEVDLYIAIYTAMSY